MLFYKNFLSTMQVENFEHYKQKHWTYAQQKTWGMFNKMHAHS
jgi:hypothetical protein